jgi:hypothetical protein
MVMRWCGGLAEYLCGYCGVSVRGVWSVVVWACGVWCWDSLRTDSFFLVYFYVTVLLCVRHCIVCACVTVCITVCMP